MKAERGVSLAVILGVLIALSCATAAQTGTIYNKDIKVVDYEDMQFPAIALLAHVEGVVVVQVKFDYQGNVTDADALSGPSLLTNLSAQNAKKWRFEPNSQKAAIIVYSFRIEGACHAGHGGGYTSQMIFFPPNFAEITVCPVPLQTNTSAKRQRN
jgi:hypothetical protein